MMTRKITDTDWSDARWTNIKNERQAYIALAQVIDRRDYTNVQTQEPVVSKWVWLILIMTILMVILVY